MKVKRVPIDTLHQDPSNARVHDERNLATITGSLKQWGQVEPLVVQAGTGRIIGGNGRLTTLKEMGQTEVDVVEVDVDDINATALGIALNRTAETASWNDSDLSRLLDTLRQAEDFDHAATGFTDEEIEDLLMSLGQIEVEEDEAPEPPDEADTQPGDLWILGDHRLICGDSSSPEDVDRLLGGATIQLVNTDPPYNVKVEPRSNNAIAAGLSSFAAPEKKHHQKFDVERHPEKAKATHKKMRAKDRPLENDFVSDEEFDRLLAAWFGNIARVLDPGGAFYIWGGYANLGNYPGPLNDAGLYFSQGIVWDKEHPVLTRKDYMGTFEICFYGWKKGAGHKWYGPNNATDLWHVKKVNPQSMVHLTEKPVELAARAIQYSSRPGENVLDLFGGSGSTLIAAEHTGRKAFLMELDAPYCDVVVQRWMKVTGRKAERVGSGAATK